MLNSIELHRTGDRTPTGNPMQSLNLTLEVEPRLENSSYTNYSTTGWYLMAGPADAVMIVAFLKGQQAPIIEEVDLSAELLGTGFRIYWDFGSALADEKSGVLSAGA